MDRGSSLSRLLVIHSSAFLFLVVISVAAAGAATVLHQDTTRRSLELSRMLQATHLLRGDLYRQVKELFDYVFIGDPDSLVEFQELGADIAAKLAELREGGAGRRYGAELGALEEAVGTLDRSVRMIMNQVQAGFPPDRLLAVFETEVEEGGVLQAERAFLASEGLMEAAQDDLIADARRTQILLGAALVVPLVAGISLLMFSWRLLRRGIVTPVSGLIVAAEHYRSGDLRFRVPEDGPAEFLTLQRGFNRMAADLTGSQEALVRAEKQASLGALVPIIAHNIRNPLASIRATAQVHDEPGLPDDLRAALGGIVRSVDRLEVWLQQFLGYLNPLQARLEPVALSDLVEGALELVGHGLSDKGLRIERGAAWAGAAPAGEARVGATPAGEIGGLGDGVQADVALLEQAVCGLLANAIEAAPAGSAIAVDILDEGPWRCLRIVDAGKGMPFSEGLGTAGAAGLSPGPTTKPGGSGLGVPFARKVCELHGGRLEFRRRDERTETWVCLPGAA